MQVNLSTWRSPGQGEVGTESTGETELWFDVHATGIGISFHVKSNLFTIFSRAGHSTTHHLEKLGCRMTSRSRHAPVDTIHQKPYDCVLPMTIKFQRWVWEYPNGKRNTADISPLLHPPWIHVRRSCRCHGWYKRLTEQIPTTPAVATHPAESENSESITTFDTEIFESVSALCTNNQTTTSLSKTLQSKKQDTLSSCILHSCPFHNPISLCMSPVMPGLFWSQEKKGANASSKIER